jgi:N-methylhydantoinase A
MAVINAYVHPKTDSYLNELQDEIILETGIKVTPFIAKSNGGRMNVSEARTRGAETLLSGPASGVVGASYIARIAGFENIITLDMGGTSADIAFISGGQPCYSTEEYVGQFPIIMPVVAVSSIGSGGGSIAWLDEMGVLKVGPDSSGADPGPACYGLGGNKPTITDAYLLCGFIDPENFAGGDMKLNKNLAEEAIQPIAKGLGLDVHSAAQAIIEVCTATMYAGVNKVFFRRGIDPRDFILVPFGGAGPTHFCFLARELHISKILVPAKPGILSALGTLCSDVKTEFIKSIRLKSAEVTIDRIQKDFEILKNQAYDYMAKEGFSFQSTALSASVDMNYVGQSFQVEVPIREEWLSFDGFREIEREFHQTHHRIYSHSDETAQTEIMNLRVTAVGIIPRPGLKELPKANQNPQPVAKRTIYYDRKSWKANIYNREDLHWGSSIDGPAIIGQDDSTIVIIDKFVGTVDQYGNILVTRKGGEPHGH